MADAPVTAEDVDAIETDLATLLASTGSYSATQEALAKMATDKIPVLLRALRQGMRVGAEPAGVAGSRMVHLSRCPGYATNGNLFRCHPDAEPGGYDVGLGMIGPLHGNPLDFDEAVELARALALWIGRAIENDRHPAMSDRSGQPLPDVITREMFDQAEPGATQIPILRAMAENGDRIVRDVAGFKVEGHPRLRVEWDMLMWLERAGYVRRIPTEPRDIGTRVLTPFGRAAAKRCAA